MTQSNGKTAGSTDGAESATAATTSATAMPGAPVSRRPNRKPRADGAASRERMLEAAGKLFARQGFDSVSVRAVAKAAGVNLSAIGYHFGDKEGLYRGVLRRLIEDSEPVMGPAAERLTSGVAAAGGDRAMLAALLAGFLRHLLGSVLVDERMRWRMQLMLREFHEPTAAFPMLLEERIHPLHNAVALLVGAATDQDAEAPETRLLTAAIIGQCMALGAARTVVCARLGWDGYTPERVDFIIRTLTPAVLAMLGLPQIEGAAAGGPA